LSIAGVLDETKEGGSPTQLWIV